MCSNAGSPEFVEKTNGLCQSPLFLDQEEHRLWVGDCNMSRKSGGRLWEQTMLGHFTNLPAPTFAINLCLTLSALKATSL